MVSVVDGAGCAECSVPGDMTTAGAVVMEGLSGLGWHGKSSER